MYPYEERMKAVNMYIKSDLNEGYVIQALGYSSPNALKYWYKEIHRNRGLAFFVMIRSLNILKRI